MDRPMGVVVGFYALFRLPLFFGILSHSAFFSIAPVAEFPRFPFFSNFAILQNYGAPSPQLTSFKRDLAPVLTFQILTKMLLEARTASKLFSALG